MWRSEELKDFNTVESEPEGHLALPNSFSQACASKAQQGACCFNLRGERRWSGHLAFCGWLEIGLENFHCNNTLNSIILLQINFLFFYFFTKIHNFFYL
jgi:hypothetical protein